MDNKKYAWSFEENSLQYSGSYSSIEECIEVVRKQNYENKKVVFIGEHAKYGTSIDAEMILDDINSNAYDTLGEIAEDYLVNIPNGQLKELENGLDEFYQEWLKKYNLELEYIDEIEAYSIETGENLSAEELEVINNE